MTDALRRPPARRSLARRPPGRRQTTEDRARERTGAAVAELDDELAVAVTAAQRIVAVSRALRMTRTAIESWRADPGRAGCLCRAIEDIRVAVALIDVLTPPRLRRATLWSGPVDEVRRYPVSSIARLLGRTVRVMHSLAEGPSATSEAGQGTAAVQLDATARRQCRTAWENAFHALVRLRAVQEAATWFPESPVDPWLLIAAEAPPRINCAECDQDRRADRQPESEGAKVIPFPVRPRTARETGHVC